MNDVIVQAGLAQIGLATAFGVGLVFVQAAFSKLRYRELVPGVVANYRLLPEMLVAPVATALPIVELAVGLCLMAGGQRLAVMAAIALLMAFAASMAINIVRGRRSIDCGCGRSQLRQPLGWALVVRNVVLAALIAPRLLAAPQPGLSELAIALAGGVSLFLLFTLFNAIVALSVSPLSLRMAGGHATMNHAHRS